MLIIFDLDDTLIETSRCLTPLALRAAFEAMGEVGSFEKLLELNARALMGSDTVVEFANSEGISRKKIIEGLLALQRPLPPEFSVDPVPGALEVLEGLGAICPLALVSRGSRDLQLQKMEKAGIQPSQFSKLVVGKGPSKKSDYQEVIEDLGVEARDVVVCGDRVSLDLSPGKELGFYTVHFVNGRGKYCSQPEGDVDLTINKLEELTRILQRHES